MKKLLPAVLLAAVAAMTSGCVIAPPRPVAVYGSGPVYGAPAYGALPYGAPVYAAPVYASPGVGWAWAAHPSYGWGWRHPYRGWHRGWR